MADPSSGRENSTEIIDEALRLVDALQRRLIVAGVRRGVSGITSPPPRGGDVWEEAVRQETDPDTPVLNQVVGIARETFPEVGRHLGAAGAVAFEAAGRTLSVVERSLRSRPRDDSGS